jgi:hypothetical protein
MHRLAARFADQWDTFPTIAGASTDGVSLSIAEQAGVLETACRELGRDPDSIRRSTWAEAEDVLASPAAFEAFVETHRVLGFTDFTAVLPPPARRDVLIDVARGVIPKLRDQDPAAI